MLGCDFKHWTDDSDGTTVIKIELSFDCARTHCSAFFKCLSPLLSTLISSVFTPQRLSSVFTPQRISSHLSSPLYSHLYKEYHSPNSITRLTHLHYCSDPAAFHLTPHGSGASTPNSSFINASKSHTHIIWKKPLSITVIPFSQLIPHQWNLLLRTKRATSHSPKGLVR